MADSILCRIGLHSPIYPLKNRKVSHLRDYEMCSRCHRTKTFDSGWVFYDDWEKNFDEDYLKQLERSCFANALGNRLPMDVWWRIMKNYDKENGITGEWYPSTKECLTLQ